MSERRYTFRLEEDRQRSGWGNHFWIVDAATGEPVEMVSQARLHDRLHELNGSPAAIKLVDRTDVE